MHRLRRQLFALGATVLLVLAIVAVLRLVQGDDGAVSDGLPPRSASAADAPVAAPATAEAGAAASPAPAARGPVNDLPRPAPGTRPAPTALPRPPEQRPRGPVDRRGGNNPRAAAELEMLSYAFETLDEDVETCLAEWRKVEPTAPVNVMIGFEIDAKGLTRSWIERDAEVPMGVKSCFANAVYGLDWSHIVENPAKITKDFDLSSTRDGGGPVDRR
jgi:hypothetical protein